MLSLFRNDPGLSPDDAARLRRVEAKLDLLLRHFGIESTHTLTAISDTVRALADRGEKIAAIKNYREETGAGLAEAKDAIDAYLRARR